jgi:hypothetical protein
MTAQQHNWFEQAPVAGRMPKVKPTSRKRELVEPAPQLDLRIVLKRAPTPKPAVAPPMESPPPPPQPTRPPFGSWLLDQTKRAGSLGDLARAAKLDRLFPRNGTADDVRARFSSAGADGDAFEALDSAEREYDRLAW